MESYGAVVLHRSTTSEPPSVTPAPSSMRTTDLDTPTSMGKLLTVLVPTSPASHVAANVAAEPPVGTNDDTLPDTPLPTVTGGHAGDGVAVRDALDDAVAELVMDADEPEDSVGDSVLGGVPEAVTDGVGVRLSDVLRDGVAGAV